MKLNKFFANKINFQYLPSDGSLADANFEPTGMPSGGITATGTTGTGAAPVLSLEMEQIREQINNINSQLEKRTETGPALEALKRQAYAEFLAFALDSKGVNFTKEDFAAALSITPEKAQSQYYEFDLTDVEPLGLTYTDEVAKAGAASTSNGLGIYGESTLPAGMKRSWTPTAITAKEVEAATNYGIMDAATLDKFLPTDLTRRVSNVTQDTPAYTVANKLPATLFDAINFPEQTINRGVPVVTKGLDAAGNPTTAVTMGNAAATPSGEDIGQLDVSTILPSTGMGINDDGTGTAKVGTLDTTGNIVATSADTLNLLDAGLGTGSTVDAGVLSTVGGDDVKTNVVDVSPAVLGTTKVCPFRTELYGTVIGINESCNPTADAAAAAVVVNDPPFVPPGGDGGVITNEELVAQVQAAEIQNLFNTSQTLSLIHISEPTRPY